MRAIKFVHILLIIFHHSRIILSRSTNQLIEIHQELIGSKIAFECPVLMGMSNDPRQVNRKLENGVKLIYWSKHPSTPISAINISNNFTMSSEPVSGDIFPRFRKRISHILELHNETSKLIFNSLSLEDEGLYRCRVDYRRSRTIERYHQLELIVPPKKMLIVDKNQQQISHSEYRIGPFDEGEIDVGIVCQTTLVKPPPKLYWFENSSLIDDSFEMLNNVSIEDSTERLWANDKRFVKAQNILKLTEPIRRQDLDRKFVCVGQNTPVSVHKPASITVQLDLYLSPVSVEITTDNRFLAGQKAALVCRSFGSRPRAQLLWFKNQEPIFENYENRFDTINNVSYSIVRFKVEPEDNGSEIRCRAVNVKMKKSSKNSISDSIVLNVQFLPIIRLDGEGSMKVNSTFCLKCMIHSNPPTPMHKIEWQRNNETLHVDEVSENVQIVNNTLLLHNSTESDSGFYRCYASNSVGRSSSQLFSLSIEFSPRCLNSSQQIVYIALDSPNSAIINCRVKANPPVVYYDWFINGTAIGQFSYTTRGGLVSSLYYRIRTLHDYGNVTCSARNSVGAMSRPCEFRLAPQGRPSSVKFCSLVSQNGYEATLKCRFSFDGGVLSGCKAQLFHFNDPLWNGTLWPAVHGRKGFSCKSDIVFNSSKLFDSADLKIRGLVKSFNEIGESLEEHEFHSTLYFMNSLKNKLKNVNNDTLESVKRMDSTFSGMIFNTFSLKLLPTIVLGTVILSVYLCYARHKSAKKEENIQMLMRIERQLPAEFV